MEDVRAVLVYEQPILVIMVIGIATNMVAPVDEQYFLVELAGKPLGQHAAGKTSTHNQIIKHYSLLPSQKPQSTSWAAHTLQRRESRQAIPGVQPPVHQAVLASVSSSLPRRSERGTH